MKPTDEDFKIFLVTMSPDERRNFERKPDAEKYRLFQAYALKRKFEAEKGRSQVQ
jgi:hypothetical protein